MNVIDIVLGILLLFGLVRGFMKGFIVELASLIALFAGIYGAIHFSYFAINYLAEWVSWEQQYIQLAAFAITFLVIVIIILLVGKILTKIAGVIALGIVNRILGGIFGALKLAFIISVILMFWEGFNKDRKFIAEEKLENSILYAPVKEIAPLVLPTILKELDERNLNFEE